MKVIYPKCHRKGKGEGICCQEAYGLVEALKFEFDWLHMIDDDVFISPTNIKNMLEQTHDHFEYDQIFGFLSYKYVYDYREWTRWVWMLVIGNTL